MSYCYVELNIMSAENGATLLYCTLILLFIIKKTCLLSPKKDIKREKKGRRV